MAQVAGAEKQSPAQIAAAEKEAMYLLLFPDDGLTKEEEDAIEQEQLKAFQLKLERYRAKVDKRNHEKQQPTSEPKVEPAAPSTNKLRDTARPAQRQPSQEALAPLPTAPVFPINSTPTPVSKGEDHSPSLEESTTAPMDERNSSKTEEGSEVPAFVSSVNFAFSTAS